MPFSEEVDAGVLNQAWTGEVDAETAYQPYESAVAAFDEHSITSVRIDLRGLEFVDSTALGSLVRIQQHAAEHGAGFSLREVPPRVRSLLSITGLDRSLAIE